MAIFTEAGIRTVLGKIREKLLYVDDADGFVTEFYNMILESLENAYEDEMEFTMHLAKQLPAKVLYDLGIATSEGKAFHTRGLLRIVGIKFRIVRGKDVPMHVTELLYFAQDKEGVLEEQRKKEEETLKEAQELCKKLTYSISPNFHRNNTVPVGNDAEPESSTPFISQEASAVPKPVRITNTDVEGNGDNHATSAQSVTGLMENFVTSVTQHMHKNTSQVTTPRNNMISSVGTEGRRQHFGTPVAAHLILQHLLG